MEADPRSAGFTDLQPVHLAIFSFPPPDGVTQCFQLSDNVIGRLPRHPNPAREVGRPDERRLIYLTPWGMVKVVHATLLEIQAEWTADIGADRFDDFMTALRRYAAHG